MTQQKQGFALLLVLLSTSAIMMVGLACWYQTSLQVDVVIERECFYKNFYSASAVLDAGLQLLKNNFDLFAGERVNAQMPVQLDLSAVIRGLQGNAYRAILTIDKPVLPMKDAALAVSVHMYEEGACRSVLRCLLVKKKRSRGAKKYDHYLVQHFTIGNLF